jgi:hypothetical protein
MKSDDQISTLPGTLFLEIVVFDLAVALEGEHSNDRIFDDPHENAMALVRDFDVRKKPVA